MKVLIIGGVASGISAALRIKRLDQFAQVIVFERGNYVSLANCGFAYHLSNIIPHREHLIRHNPQTLHQQGNIKVRAGHEVLKIDRETRLIYVRNKKDNFVYSEDYDKLIIATGADPIKPNILGIGSPRINTLWTIQDMDDIKKHLLSGRKHITIIGGGFIGLEAAENLHKDGHIITLIEKSDQVFPSLDKEMAAYIYEELLHQGIDLRLKTELKSIQDRGRDILLLLNSGPRLRADLVILALGTKPNSQLAKACGLDTSIHGGIAVNECLQTSDPHIYAIGDVIESMNLSIQFKSTTSFAGAATRQARIVAENILGSEEVYKGLIPTSICRIISLTAASTGLNEKEAISLKIPFHKIYTHVNSHDGYYPGAKTLHMKMLYTEGGNILGAQIVGARGVDKRIDVLSIAIRHKLSVFDLQEEDFAYAPHYGSPRDPIHVLAFVATNHLQGRTNPLSPDQLNEEHTILDVREYEEAQLHPLRQATHIPLAHLNDKLDHLDKTKKIVVSCSHGTQGHFAERILKQHGFQVFNLSGGYETLRMMEFSQNKQRFIDEGK